MDLGEVLNNPLFVPLLVALITIIGNAWFLYWLRKWQYKAEYIVRNVENTYIPIVAEINDRLEHFAKFCEEPEGLNYSFQELERVKKSGLFEFIKSHDKKLYEKLIFFYNQICPKFRELCELNQKTRSAILSEWTNYVTTVIEDKKAKDYSISFVNELSRKGIYHLLLSDKRQEIPKLWHESLYHVTEMHNLYSPYVKVAEDKIMISRNGKFPTFNISEEDLDKLIELSQPMLQELLGFYKKNRTLLDKEVVKGLIPMMQKYISNPLSN